MLMTAAESWIEVRSPKSWPLKPPRLCPFDKKAQEMHLWPSLKLRNSFKSSTSHKSFQRINSGKQTQSNQQKLLCSDKEPGPEVSSGGFAVLCRDLAMLLSCCFCCGACIDEEDNGCWRSK